MRNTLKTTTLERKFPLLAVENGCIISKDADKTVAFRVELPELFTVTSAEYEAIHSAWYKAIKVLPDYSIVHKQDFFIKENYQPDTERDELSFLSRSFERHFNERPFLNHYCYLFLTKTTRERSRRQSDFSTLCRGRIVPQEIADMEAAAKFIEAVGQFERIMNDSGFVTLTRLALVTGFAVWNSYSFAEKQRQKIYVLDNGKSLMLALSQDMAQNRPVEAKSHVRRFHELFFTLSPDKGAIESNIKRSLFLADKTAFNYYKDLAEKGYYNRVISGNVTQTVEIDSVKCDFDQYPYKVNTYARQLIVRESSLTVRSLVTSCRLLNATRSDNNPHGFIIEAFTITENKDLQTVKR